MGKDAREPAEQQSTAGDVPVVRLSAPTPALPPGIDALEPTDPTRVGPYALVGRLGVGGMGTVYLGQAPDGTRVAVKVVHAHLAVDQEFRERFVDEVRAGQRVPAFCTARYIDSGTVDGRPYLVSEYIDGVPLSDLIAAEGPLDPATLHALAAGVATCVAAIHRVGLVHRDVKPGNVIVTLGGVRIVDFGIARALHGATQHTATGVVMGSLGWAAPEQLGGEAASPAMDVFGWGALVAYAATGQHPYGGPDMAARAWRIMHAEPDLDGVPDSLRALVSRAMRRVPGERPTAADLVLELTGGHESGGPHSGGPLSAGPLSAGPHAGQATGRSPNTRRRKQMLVLVAGAPVALALVIGAASGLKQHGTGPAVDRSRPSAVPSQRHGSADSDAPDRPAADRVGATGTAGGGRAGGAVPAGQGQAGAPSSTPAVAPAPPTGEGGPTGVPTDPVATPTVTKSRKNPKKSKSPTPVP